MREKSEYRDNLEDLLRYFEGKRLITKTEAAAYLGIDVRTATKRYGIGKEGITLPALARKLTN